MLSRINWKSVFRIFTWAICLGGLIALMSFIDIKKKTLACKNVVILIPGADNFIEREEIDAILKQSQGVLIGKELKQVNLEDIEKKIKSNPYIAYATVYADMNGIVNIKIDQRQPILRVINAGDQDFYVDKDGLKMPVSPNFTASVLVANGKILEHFSGKIDTLITKLARDLYKTALYIKKDTLWNSQIEQAFVNDKNDIELIPRVGNQRIILGNADSLEVKMRNLRAFYKEAMPKVGWDTYKTINIKYINQVVCEKNKIDSLSGKVVNASKYDSSVKVRLVIDPLLQEKITDKIEMESSNDLGKKANSATSNDNKGEKNTQSNTKKNN